MGWETEPGLQGWMDLVVIVINIAALIGLLVGLLYAIFKIGRYSESLIGGIERLELAFREHTAEENKRFADIDKKLKKHGEQLGVLSQHFRLGTE